MANLSAINVVAEKDATAAAFMVGTDEFAVPLGDMIDVEAEIPKQEAQRLNTQADAAISAPTERLK